MHEREYERERDMGLMLGRITAETPQYEIVQKNPDYEIRKYSPSVVAQVTYDPAQHRGEWDGGFMVLANYIGAFGEPQNTKPEKIDMTAPVITKSAAPPSDPEKIAMTAPVITTTSFDEKRNGSMQLVLPSKYRRAEDAPMPLDARVAIKEEGERKYAVVKFSGVATDQVVAGKVEKLRSCLERDGVKVVGDYLLARYNPPWTLPPLKTNEVMISVEHT